MVTSALTVLPLQTKPDTFANIVDLDEMACNIRIYTVCHSAFDCGDTPILTMDMPKFKDGRTQLRNKGLKGLTLLLLHHDYQSTTVVHVRIS